MKEALASISGGNRSPEISTSAGTPSRFTIASTATRRPPRVRIAGRIPCAGSSSSLFPCWTATSASPTSDSASTSLSWSARWASLSVTMACASRCWAPSWEVADHAAACLVARCDETRPRGEELLATVGVRDDDRRPDARAHAPIAEYFAIGPSAAAKCSMRDGRPLRRTAAVTL
jgi:hypothetical protein